MMNLDRIRAGGAIRGLAGAVVMLSGLTAGAQPAEEDAADGAAGLGAPGDGRFELFGGAGLGYAGDSWGWFTLDGGGTAWLLNLWGGRLGGGFWFTRMPALERSSVTLALRQRWQRLQLGVGGVHYKIGDAWRAPGASYRGSRRITPYVELLVNGRRRPVTWSVGCRIGETVGAQSVLVVRWRGGD